MEKMTHATEASQGNNQVTSEFSDDLTLAHRINSAAIAREQLANPNTQNTDTSEDSLKEMIEDGVSATDEFYDKYDRLIRYEVNKILGKTGVKMGFDDAYQVAWEHALKGAQRYAGNEEQRFPLVTYVVGFLDDKIKRHDTSYKSVRLPVNIDGLVRRVLAVNNRRLSMRMPIMSDEEIAELTGVPVGPADHSANGNITTGTLHDAIRMTKLMGSIDTGLNPNEDFTNHDGYDGIMQSVFDDPRNNGDIGDEVSTKLAYSAVRDMIGSVLSERAQKVIMMRYGLDDGEPKDLNAVAKELNVTRERVRQIETKALSLLRRPVNQRAFPGIHGIPDHETSSLYSDSAYPFDVMRDDSYASAEGEVEVY